MRDNIKDDDNKYIKNEYFDINTVADNSNKQSQEEISSYSETFKSEGQKAQPLQLTKREKKILKRQEKVANKRPRKYFRNIWIVMVLIISIALSEFLLIGMVDVLALNRTTDTRVSVSIPKGASHKDIASILKTAGAIQYEDYFNDYLNLFKRSAKFSKGDYDIPIDLDYASIVGYLQTPKNRTDVFPLTFPEGKNVVEYAQILEENQICSKEDFLKECNSDGYDSSYTFIKDITNAKDRYYKLEGYLFPDTYNTYKDSEPSDIIVQMLSNYKKKIMGENDVDGYKKPVSLEQVAKDKGTTMEQVLNLASIVQSEAADTDDMKIIVGIFTNRLNAGANSGVSQLGSDATVYYPYRSKDQAPQGYKSKYNTYEIQGLPPGPICNPSMDAINAVLNPKKTNYMYFAHDKNGKPYYASNEAAHNNNLAVIESVNSR